jgi:transposase-like protein
VVRFGKTAKGIQRYQCKDCKTTFTETAGTPLYHNRKADKWLDFVECELLGLSLRESSKRINVHYVNLFYWRHKFYASLAKIDVESFEGIVEADETFFLESEKGNRSLDRKGRKRGGSAKKRGLSKEQICVLTARDRSKTTHFQILGRGKASSQEIENGLGDRLDESNTLCSDKLQAYSAYCREHGIKNHIRFGSKEKRTKGIYHIQNINSYHSRLHNWLAKYNGVATKYLGGYIAMFNFLDSIGFGSEIENIRKIAVEVLSNRSFETRNSLRMKKMDI